MRASRALYAAAELGVADILAPGPMTSREIASAAGVDAPTMRRLMRALVAHGLFEEPAFDRFSLNAAGELLRRDVPGPSAPEYCSQLGTCAGSCGRIFLNACAPARRLDLPIVVSVEIEGDLDLIEAVENNGEE